MAYESRKKESLDTVQEMQMVEVITEAHQAAAASWSRKEERRVLLKLDLYLMPLLMFGFFVLQLDRSNIGNALTNTITRDLHITNSNVNVGNQLMSLGTVISEIPSNLILQRLGAPTWMTALLFVWGTVALTQAFVTNLHSFYATRFLLGVFEGGYIPGAQYVLALFYTPKELGLRTSIFYFGNYFAQGTGSLIAAGILQMDGTGGLAGWQWLFLLEGTLTLVMAAVFLILAPTSPYTTRPIHGLFDWFSAKDKTILQWRVHAAYGGAMEERARITKAGFLEAILDVRPWLHLLLNVASLAPKGGLQLYTPSIIKSLGFDQLHANLLNSVSSYVVVILSAGISLASDKTQNRGAFCIAGFLWSITFGAALMGVPTTSNKWVRYALVTLLSGGNALAQALNDAWLSINAKTPHARSIGLAMVVMGSNIGAIIGPQLFQPSDAPSYTHAFLAILLLYISSFILTLLIMYVYWQDNKKLVAVTGQAGREGREGTGDQRRRQL